MNFIEWNALQKIENMYGFVDTRMIKCATIYVDSASIENELSTG